MKNCINSAPNWKGLKHSILSLLNISPSNTHPGTDDEEALLMYLHNRKAHHPIDIRISALYYKLNILQQQVI